MANLPRLLDDGTIIYPRRGKTPPLDIEGYKRKSKNGPDAWIFIPTWKFCQYRKQIVRHQEDCKCDILVDVCNHPQGGNLDLNTSRCNNCVLCPNS